MVDLHTRYLGLELRSPLVASSSPLTGSLDGLRRLEAAGAGALELNVYYVSTSPGLSATDVERRYLDLVQAVRRAVRIPLAVKLSPYFSAMANLARRLVAEGADGLVLFNRFYQPDLDVEALGVVHGVELSTPAELRLPLRWIAILHGHLGAASLAASSGVHTAQDVVKALLAGADVAMMTSALLRHGPEHLAHVEADLRQCLGAHGHASPDQLRGRLSQRVLRDPQAWERANYTKMLTSHAVGEQAR